MMWAIVRRASDSLRWGSASFLDREPTHDDIHLFAVRNPTPLARTSIEVFRVEPAGRYTAVEKSSFDVTREDA
jgi:hypothetical protein